MKLYDAFPSVGRKGQHDWDCSTLTRGDVVAVQWRDAIATHEWLSNGEVDAFSLAVFNTVAFFWKAEDGALTLHDTCGEDLHGGLWVIPISQIVQFSVILKSPLEDTNGKGNISG